MACPGSEMQRTMTKVPFVLKGDAGFAEAQVIDKSSALARRWV